MTEKPKRLRISHPFKYFGFACLVELDGRSVLQVCKGSTSEEARAAAQAYVDELIKHFREGGE